MENGPCKKLIHRDNKLKEYNENRLYYHVGYGGISGLPNPMGRVEEPVNPYIDPYKDSIGFVDAFLKFEKGCLIDPRRIRPKPWEQQKDFYDAFHSSTSITVNCVFNDPDLFSRILKLAVEKEFMEVQARFHHYKNLRKVHQKLDYVMSTQKNIYVPNTQEQYCSRKGISMPIRWRNRGLI